MGTFETDSLIPSISAPVARGAHGPIVRLIQEWLCLNGHVVQIDGDFGPATEGAVRDFQSADVVPASGRVDPATFSRLVATLAAALEPLRPASDSLGQTFAACARQHLAQHPREVGGDNRGPWVRLYMAGEDGPEFRWCAGFLSLLLAQSASALSRAVPFPRTTSCDVLAGFGKQIDRFVARPARPEAITEGSIFLVRGAAANDWIHTGVVIEVGEERFRTIEGNSNDDGSANGFEVTSRSRRLDAYDFIRID